MKRSARHIRLTGDCNNGQFTAYSKTGKKIGHLKFESETSGTVETRAAMRAITRGKTYDSTKLPKTWSRVTKIVVLPRYEGRGVATTMYSELCKFLTEQCPIITTLSGAVGSKGALKSRTKVFGIPRRIRWQDLEKIRTDENYHEEYISYEKAMNILPQRMTTKKFEIIGSGETVDVLSNVKGCRFV